MVDQSVFDIPTKLRDLTEQCIKAQTAYGQLMHSLTQGMNTWPGAPSNTIATGFQQVQERAMEFAKENAESSIALASELAHSKDLQEMLSIQSRYAQTQFQTYARQVQELGRMMGEAMGGVARPT